MVVDTTKCQKSVANQPCDSLADAYCKSCQIPICRKHACVIGEKIVCCDCEKSITLTNSSNNASSSFYQSTGFIDSNSDEAGANLIADTEQFEQDFDGS